MKIYVARNDNFNIVNYGEKSVNVTSHKNISQRDWGYAWLGGMLFTASANTGVLGLDQNLKLKHFFPIDLKRPHQIFGIKDSVYITASGSNEIWRIKHPFLGPSAYDKSSQTQIESFENPAGTWVNSINKIDNLFYAVSHNHGYSTIFSFEDFEKISDAKKYENVGFTCHNCWKMNGKIWTLSSGEGVATTLDRSERINIGGFPRGVAMTDKYLLVGVTRRRTSSSIKDDPAPVVDMEKWVCDDRAGIAVFDITKKYEFVNYIPLGQEPIHEIRIMDEEDKAIGTHGVFKLPNTLPKFEEYNYYFENDENWRQGHAD